MNECVHHEAKHFHDMIIAFYHFKAKFYQCGIKRCHKY